MAELLLAGLLEGGAEAGLAGLGAAEFGAAEFGAAELGAIGAGEFGASSLGGELALGAGSAEALGGLEAGAGLFGTGAELGGAELASEFGGAPFGLEAGELSGGLTQTAEAGQLSSAAGAPVGSAGQIAQAGSVVSPGEVLGGNLNFFGPEQATGIEGGFEGGFQNVATAGNVIGPEEAGGLQVGDPGGMMSLGGPQTVESGELFSAPTGLSPYQPDPMFGINQEGINELNNAGRFAAPPGSLSPTNPLTGEGILEPGSVNFGLSPEEMQGGAPLADPNTPFAGSSNFSGSLFEGPVSPQTGTGSVLGGDPGQFGLATEEGEQAAQISSGPMKAAPGIEAPTELSNLGPLAQQGFGVDPGLGGMASMENLTGFSAPVSEQGFGGVFAENTLGGPAPGFENMQGFPGFEETDPWRAAVRVGEAGNIAADPSALAPPSSETALNAPTPGTEALQTPSAPQPTAQGPTPAATRALNGGSIIPQNIAGIPTGAILPAAAIGYNVLKGPDKLPGQARTAQQLAEQQQAFSSQQLSMAQQGQLNPAQLAAIDRFRQDAQNRLYQQLAAQGVDPRSSTAFRAGMEQIDQQAQTMMRQFIDQMFQQAFTASGQSSATLQNLAQLSIAQDTAFRNSIQSALQALGLALGGSRTLNLRVT